MASQDNLASISAVKLRKYLNWNEAGKSSVDYVRDFGNTVLRGVLNPADRDLLARTISEFEQATFYLSRCIEQLAKNEPVPLEVVAQQLSKVILGSFVVGLSGAHSAEAKKHINELNAQRARQSRRESRAEIALRDAIMAEHGSGPVPRPTKEAGVILDGVNKRLRDAGHSKVKVDVIRRRLEKLPRS